LYGRDCRQGFWKKNTTAIDYPQGQKLSACGDCFFKTRGKKIFAFSAKFLQTFPASPDGNNFAVSKPMNKTD